MGDHGVVVWPCVSFRVSGPPPGKETIWRKAKNMLHPIAAGTSPPHGADRKPPVTPTSRAVNTSTTDQFTAETGAVGAPLA